jgi:hypothetical protein
MNWKKKVWKEAVVAYFTEGTEEISESQSIQASGYDWNPIPLEG